jgi:hypothetical protein
VERTNLVPQLVGGGDVVIFCLNEFDIGRYSVECGAKAPCRIIQQVKRLAGTFTDRSETATRSSATNLSATSGLSPPPDSDSKRLPV